MLPQYQPRVVEVAATKADGCGYEFATGFAISPSRILTCAHVLRDNKGIQVRFVDVDRTRRLDVFEVWNGEKQATGSHDVAVLEMNPKEVPNLGVQLSAVLSLRCPTDDEKWNSRGLLSAVATANPSGGVDANVEDFKGEVASPRISDGVMTLYVTDAPNVPEGWAGASGSAIFTNHGLVAVVRSWPEAWKGHRLKATCLSHLRELPGFTAAVGLVNGEDELAKAKATVRALLSMHPELVAALADAGAISNNTTEGVVDELFLIEVESLLQLLADVQSIVTERKDTDSMSAVQLLACFMLPFLYDYAMVLSLRGEESRDPMALLSIPVSTQTVSEIVMAGLDGRPAEFVRRGSKGPVMQGTRAIPSVPDCGIDKKKRHSIASLKEDLANAVLDADSKGSVRNDAELVDAIRAALRVHAQRRRKPSRYYLLVRTGPEYAHELAIAHQLKTLIPELRTVSLSGGNTTLETTIKTQLHEILRNARHKGPFA